MFNVYNRKRIIFKSNPSLPDKPRVVPHIEDGHVSNEVIYEPQSNKSFWDGTRFNSSESSLRAKLLHGVPLQPVSFGQLENDPAVLNRTASNLEASISQKLEEINNSNPE